MATETDIPQISSCRPRVIISVWKRVSARKMSASMPRPPTYSLNLTTGIPATSFTQPPR